MERHPNLSPEEYLALAAEGKRRAAARQVLLTQRLSRLRDKAEQARAQGDTELAQRLDNIASKLESGPKPPHQDDWWANAHARKMRLRGWWLQYGEQLRKPEVEAEFRKHALRIARLRRMREVAETFPVESRRADLSAQIDVLLEQEAARHNRVFDSMVTPLHGPTTSTGPGHPAPTPPSSSGGAAASGADMNPGNRR